MKISKIITGGQSGADLAGNYFAKRHGIETEINTFKEFKPSYDILPNDIKINYVCDATNYILNLKCRTKYNVVNSDFTIILLNKPLGATRGSRLTVDYCKHYKRSCYYVNIYNGEGTVYDCDSKREFYYLRTQLAKRYMNFTEESVFNIAGQRTLDRADCIKFLERLLLEDDEKVIK